MIPRFLFAAIFVIAALCLSPAVLFADDIDGTYKFKSGSGEFEVDGKEYSISTSDLKNFATIKNAKTRISNNKLKVNLRGVRDTFDAIPGKISVTGPSTITLKKQSSTGKYKGRGVVNAKIQAGAYEVKIKVVLNATVNKKTLTLRAPVTGEIEYLFGLFDGDVDGDVKVVARR